MTANSLYASVGGLSLPLSDTSESTAASLDPGRDILLALLTAALNDELAARWSSAVAGTQMELSQPVQTALPHLPDKQLAQSSEIKFPLLCCYETGKSIPTFSNESTFPLDIVVPASF